MVGIFLFASGADLLQTRKCRLSEADFCTNNKFPIGNYLKNSPWFMSHSLTPFYYCATIPKIFQPAICGYWQDITFIGGGKNMEWIDRQSFHCIQPWEIVFLHWLVWQRWWSGSPDQVMRELVPPAIASWLEHFQVTPASCWLALVSSTSWWTGWQLFHLVSVQLCRLSYAAQQTSWIWNHNVAFLVEHWRWGRPPF